MRILPGHLALFLLAVLSMAGCAGGRRTAAPVTLTVFAAASLAEVFGEIGERFDAEQPGVTVVNNLGGSQQLAQQLAAGAPGDVFASANARQMAVAVESGRVAAGAARPFAGNRLVVIYPANNPAGLLVLTDLARPGLRLVLAASEVPVGQYSLEFVDKAAAADGFGPAYRDGVLANVVSYEENVRAVLTKVALGEADGGIVYSSDLARADGVSRLEIPEALNVLASYPIAPVADSANPALAAAYVAFVLSPAGQEILSQHGFMAAGE